MNTDKLDRHLELHSTPLDPPREDENWWHIGTISVSKKHPTFTSGFAHPTSADTHFETQWFEIGNKRGWAIVLESGGKPPEYFVGWVPPEDERNAVTWVTILNTTLRSARGEREAVGARAVITQLTFEQGAEFAPDSPWGYQRVVLTDTGVLQYENRDRGNHRVVNGRVAPERVRVLCEHLKRTSFPAPPENRFLPGSSVITLSVAPTNERMLIDYFTALKLPGYSDLVRELTVLCEALRESKTEMLQAWKFVP